MASARSGSVSKQSWSEDSRPYAKVSALWIAAMVVIVVPLEWADVGHLGELGAGVLVLGWLLHLVTERFPPSRKDVRMAAVPIDGSNGGTILPVGYWLIFGVLRVGEAHRIGKHKHFSAYTCGETAGNPYKYSFHWFCTYSQRPSTGLPPAIRASSCPDRVNVATPMVSSLPTLLGIFKVNRLP